MAMGAVRALVGTVDRGGESSSGLAVAMSAGVNVSGQGGSGSKQEVTT